MSEVLRTQRNLEELV